MAIFYQLRYKVSPSWKHPILSLETHIPPGMAPQNMPGNIIGDDLSRNGLLKFVNEVIRGTNEHNDFQTEGYTAKAFKEHTDKTLKIFFHLSDDYQPGYISPADMKFLLEIWIREREKFDKDPEKYMEEMIRKGAVVLRPEDCRNSAVYEKKLSEAKYGVIEDWCEEKSDKPDVLPRESSGKGKTGVSSKPWWHFWK